MSDLKKLREEKKLSQQKLAELTGIPQGTISDYETGRNKPDLIRGQKLAKTLGISLEDLIEIVLEQSKTSKTNNNHQ